MAKLVTNNVWSLVNNNDNNNNNNNKFLTKRNTKAQLESFMKSTKTSRINTNHSPNLPKHRQGTNTS